MAALAASAVQACGAPTSPAVPTDAIANADVGPNCPAHQVQPGATACCPGGTFWHRANAHCQPVGPPECATQLASDPAACVPRWCWDYMDADNKPCDPAADRCAPVGRRCTQAEQMAGTGCMAGQVPDGQSPQACVAAGSWSGSGVPGDWPGALATLPPVPTLSSAVSAKVPPLVPLPAPDDLFACRDSETAPLRLCSAAETALCVRPGPGLLPVHPSCVHVGVDWPGGSCPSGYVTVPPNKPDTLPGCTPDLALCGNGPYPEMPPGLTVAHVSALDGDDAAEGTASAPLRTIGQALKRVGAGMAQAVAVAAGSYVEAVVINGPVAVRGRCAAMTTLSGPAGIDTLTVTSGAKGAISFWGFRIAGPGRGVRVAGGGSISLNALWIAGVQRAGVTVTANGPAVQLSNTLVTAVQGPGTGSDHGRGVVVEGGGTVAASGIRISACRDAAVYVSGVGSSLVASNLLVDGTLPNANDGSAGRGVRVRQGAKATLNHVRLSGNRDLGLAAFDAGTFVQATALLVDGTLPQQADKDWGYGVAVAGGAKVTLAAARLTANHSRGAAVQDANSTLELRAVVVDHTLYPPAVGGSAVGLEVTAAGAVTVDGLRLSQNAGFGAYLDGSGSALTASGVLVDATMPHPAHGTFGRGVQAQAGATLSISHARLTANRDAGFIVTTKATAMLTDVVVDGTLPQASDGRWGVGVQAGQGASLKLLRVRLDGNSLASLVSRGAATQVRAHEITINATHPQPADAVGGIGVVCEAGGQLDLARARLSGNRHAGLALADAGSHVRGWGVLIDATLPGDTDVGLGSAAVQVSGAGLAGGFGARLLLAGSRVVANTSAGIALSQAGASTLAGVVVEDHASNATGQSGVGLMFEAGLTPVQLLSVRSARNRAAAIALHTAAAALDGCVLLHTSQGKLAKADANGKPSGTFVALADGLVVGFTAGVTIARSLAFGNPRAGLLFAGAKDLKVTGSWAGGGLYGVALENTAKPALDGAWVMGSVAAVASDAGLEVPAPPVVVKLAVE